MNEMETNNDSDTLFEVSFSLPEEIYVNIFSFLEPSDLSLGVSLVSHSWNYFSSSDLLWRPLFYRKFGARGLSKVLAVKLSPESDGHCHELQHEQEEEETEVEAEQVSHDKYDWKGLYRYKSSMDQVWYGNSNKHPRVSKLRVHPPASYVSSPTLTNQRANDSTSFFGYNSMKGLRCGPNLSDLCVFTSVGKEIVRRTFNMDQWTNQRVHNGDDEEDVQDSAAVDTNDASGVEVVDADVVFPVQSQFTWSIDYNPIRFGNRMISGGIENCLRVWNADSGELVHGIEVQKCGIWSNRILDSSHVVAGFSDNLVKVFDVNNASQPVAVYTENEASVYDVDCDSELPETNLFVTGSSDKSVRVFDVRVPNESVIKLKDLPDAIYELECSQMASDNIVIAGTNRGSILMIDIRMASNEDSANTASLVCNFPLAYGSAIRQMNYNGKRLVVCLSYGTVVVTTDRSVEVNFTPQELSELYRNHIDVQQIALTPNLPFRVTNMFTDRESMCMYADDEVMMVGTSANYLSLLDFRTTARPAPQVTHQTDERSPLRKPSTCLLQ